MLYDAQGQELMTPEENETSGFENLPLFNFPAPTSKPDWFDKKVNEIGGWADNATKTTPRYRVVWGMDTEIKQFAMGKMRMKYVSMTKLTQTTLGYNVVNTQTQEKRFIEARLAHAMYQDPKTKQLTANVNPGELLVPVIKEEEDEIGTPLWIVEQWVPSIALGTKKEWEDNRWLSNPEDALQYIDVLGEYPEHGLYIHWFDLIDLDEEGHEIYRELDEAAIEIIRANHIANIARRKRAHYYDPLKAKKKKADWLDEEWAKMDADITHGMEDVKKNRKFDITGKG